MSFKGDSMSKPISPKDVAKFKADTFPAYVFDAFNQLISENYNNRSATVKQKDVVTRMLLLSDTANKDDIFSKGYLNVEEIYRAQGWKVSYDKPGYIESYDAYFEFRG
jgi:hypothetical protein